MKIEHAALYVRDLERTRSFFGQYFGAVSNDRYHNPRTDFESYFLTFDSGARLEIMTKPGLQERCPEVFGFAHLAFSVGSPQAVDDLTARLRADGFSVISGPRTTGDGYYESVILDHEGNQIEITV
jgi:lactoylglutathione lyase